MSWPANGRSSQAPPSHERRAPARQAPPLVWPHLAHNDLRSRDSCKATMCASERRKRSQHHLPRSPGGSPPPITTSLTSPPSFKEMSPLLHAATSLTTRFGLVSPLSGPRTVPQRRGGSRREGRSPGTFATRSAERDRSGFRRHPDVRITPGGSHISADARRVERADRLEAP